MDTENIPLGQPLTEGGNNKIGKNSLITNYLQKAKNCFPRIEWTWIIGVRIFIIVGASIGMIFNTIYGLAMPSTQIDCILDKTFAVTKFMNTFFSGHLYAKKFFIIFTSLYTDCIILYTLLYWSFYGKSLRLLFSLIIYYITHTLIRLFFFVQYPTNDLWEYPGFPSIFVSYVKTSAMFFTNCVGLLMICLMEWRANRQMIQMNITLVCIIFECFIMHSLRAHYVIDLFSGIFIGHYLFIFVDYFAEYIDQMFKLKKINFKK